MRLDKFKGLNNQQAPTEFGLGGMVQAQNVDITDANKLRLRNGKTRLVNTAIQSAWSSGDGDVLYIANDTLYLMQNNLPVLSQSIKSDVYATNQLQGVKINGELYWSTGAQSGIYGNGRNKSLGIETPLTPAATQFTGQMPPGTYMYAVTHTRFDGFESCAGLSGTIEITQGGIDVLATSADADISHATLYLTTANEDVLFNAVTAPINTHLLYAGDTVDLNTPLKYQFCDKPPHFNLATLYRGCVYYAHGDLLLASKPFNFQAIDYATDYVQFDSSIVMVEAVEAGLFVSTQSETVFLSGNSIKDFMRNKVLDYGAIKGTEKRIYASTINPQSAGNVVLWASNRGLIAGFDSGQVANLTDGVFAFDDALIGTSALREENGLRQLLITLA